MVVDSSIVISHGVARVAKKSQPSEHTTVIVTKVISNAIQIARNITGKI